MKETVTRRIRVYGIVQGVGFRPTVSRHATTCNIHGSVSNKGPYVEIFAQAPEAQVDRFVTMIREQSPKRAAILKMNIEDVENPEIYKNFQIVENERGNLCLSGYCNLRRVPGRDVSAGEQAVSASIYQLYMLRTETDYFRYTSV